MTDAIEVAPLPEVLKTKGARKWDVSKSSSGSVRLRRSPSNFLAVPQGDSPYDNLVRAHEYVHARISPMNPDSTAAKYGLNPIYLQTAENVRVNHYLKCVAQIDTSAGMDPPEVVKAYATLADKTSFAATFLRALDYLKTGSYSTFLEGLAQTNLDRATLVFRLCSQVDLPYQAPFSVTIALAQWIDRVIEAAEEEAERAAEEGKANSVSKLRPKQRIKQASRNGMAKLHGLRRDCIPELRLIPQSSPELWWPMTIEAPPRTRRTPARISGFSHGPTSQGSVFRYYPRYCTDRKLFVRRDRKPGGTVLLDGSGSMSLRPSQIIDILTAAAGAQIAIYSGDAEGGFAKSGKLRVVAKDQQIVPENLCARPTRGCGNDVDGPALDWLAKQAEPRIWISDGQVVGRAGAITSECLTDCLKKCRQASIVRVDNVPAALALLKQLAT